MHIYMHVCIYGNTKDRVLPLFMFYIILHLYYTILYFDIFNYSKQESFISSSDFLRTLKLSLFFETKRYMQCRV